MNQIRDSKVPMQPYVGVCLRDGMPFHFEARSDMHAIRAYALSTEAILRINTDGSYTAISPEVTR